jgi:hypothetical protein
MRTTVLISSTRWPSLDMQKVAPHVVDFNISALVDLYNLTM